MKRPKNYYKKQKPHSVNFGERPIKKLRAPAKECPVKSFKCLLMFIPTPKSKEMCITCYYYLQDSAKIEERDTRLWPSGFSLK